MKRACKFIDDRLGVPLLIPLSNSHSDEDDDSLELGQGLKGNQGERKKMVKWNLFKLSAIEWCRNLFVKPGDFLIFCLFLIFVACLSWFTFGALFATYGDEIDLSNLDPLFHASHDEEPSESSALRHGLSLFSFYSRNDVPLVFENECRQVSELERLQGRSFRGTNLPILLETMCSLAHDEAGGHEVPLALSPRMINATTLVDKFAASMGWTLDQIDTTSRSISDQISKTQVFAFDRGKTMMDIHASVSNKSKVLVNERKPIFHLEDLCVITYKDTNGLCFHYMNPEIISKEKEIGAIVQRSREERKDGVVTEEWSTSFANFNPATFIGSAAKKLVNLYPDVMGQTYSSLTVKSKVFRFLGSHQVAIPSKLFLMYNPLVEKEHEYIDEIDMRFLEKRTKKDDMHETLEKERKQSSGVKKVSVEELQEVINKYTQHVASKLKAPNQDQVWFGSVPPQEKISVVSRERVSHLTLNIEVLRGSYVSLGEYMEEEVK